MAKIIVNGCSTLSIQLGIITMGSSGPQGIVPRIAYLSVCPALFFIPHLTVCNGSCSYFVWPLTLIEANIYCVLKALFVHFQWSRATLNIWNTHELVFRARPRCCSTDYNIQLFFIMLNITNNPRESIKPIMGSYVWIHSVGSPHPLPLYSPQYLMDLVYIWYSNWALWDQKRRWLWDFNIDLLGVCATSNFIDTHWHFLEPALVQPLTAIVAWPLLIMTFLCLFCRILWHFEIFTTDSFQSH